MACPRPRIVANATFLLGDADTAIDGFVIVLKGKFTSSITPLKLFEVG